jgi:hypothetical protein
MTSPILAVSDLAVSFQRMEKGEKIVTDVLTPMRFTPRDRSATRAKS